MPTNLPQSAIARAAELYAERHASLALVLEAYLRNPLGYVVKRPEFFLLARPCLLADPDRWLQPQDPQDAWYVQMAVGAPGINGAQLAAAALREMPYLLPHCCWHREWRADGGRLHVFRTDLLIRKTRISTDLTRRSMHHGQNHNRSAAAA